MADIDFKNSINADTAYVDGHKVKLIAVPDGTLELPISANDEYGYVVDANSKKHRVLLTAFLEGDPDFKSSATEDTAYMTVNGQKVKVRLAAKLNGTKYVSNSPNDNDCYTEDDDGNRHRTMLVTMPTGTLELPTSETDDSAYVIDDNGKKHKVRLFAVLAGGTTIVEVTISGIPPLSLLGAVEDSLSELKAYGGLLQSGVPGGYTAVEYVERPSGNTEQYIETNWKPNLAKNIRVQGIATYMGSDTNYRPILLGNYTGNRTSTLNIEFDGRTQNNLRIYTLKANAGTGGDLQVGPFATNDVVDFDIQITGSNGALAVSATVGGTTITGSGTIENVGEQTLYNMMIFKDHRATTTSASKVASRIHYLKATEGDKVVFELIPAVRNSDNAVGFYDKVSGQFLTNQGTGTFTAGNEIVPTPSDPMDIYCNNGKISVLDHTNWNVITNPTSQTGQGMFINSDGKLSKASDRGAGVFIPVTVGKQYTVTIHKKTIGIGTYIRYGQSNNGTVPNSAEQLLDWYRGSITDGMMFSFIAKRPYFVMQLSPDFVEAGGIDEAIEVIEAQGSDYTFVDSITADGTQYIDTGILAGSDIKAEVKFKPTNTSAAYCALGGRDFSSGDNRNAFGIWANVSGRTRFDFQSNSVSSTLGSSTTNWNIAVKDGVKNYFNGTQEESNTTATFASTRNMYLFGMLSGSSVTGNMVGSIAYCRIWKAGVLVRDFMPAIRNSDNVVGMYDTVSGTFFENQGTGVFVAGTPLGDGEVLKLTPSNDTAGVANLFAVNTYKDVQEIITGATTHKVGVYVFNGTEDWTEGSTTSLSISKTSLGTSTTVLPSTSTDIVCTHYQALGTSAVEDAIWVGASNVNFRVRATYATISDWKTFLAGQYAAGTPVIVVYPLETAQDEVAPVPQTMQVVAGDNVLDIVQAGMSGLEVSATYMKGVSVTISEIEDANIGNSVEVVIA